MSTTISTVQTGHVIIQYAAAAFSYTLPLVHDAGNGQRGPHTSNAAAAPATTLVEQNTMSEYGKTLLSPH